MENNNNQVQNTAAQAAQNQAPTNNGAQDVTNDKPLTTEQFHALLKMNTIELSGARVAYAADIADLKQEYDDTLTKILEEEHQANDELRGAREEFERAKEYYEQTLRALKKKRNEAGRKQDIGKAEAKNRWTSANEDIQAKRHDIFEWYRNSGGGTHGSRGRTPSSRLDQNQGRRGERWRTIRKLQPQRKLARVQTL